MTLDIREMAVEELVPADYNPRTATRKATARLTASIRRFGLVEPLIWNETTGRVVGGHLRLSIAKSLGIATVPVSVVRLDDLAEKALNVVLNNHEAQGRYNPTKLGVILTALQEQGQLEDTGFDVSLLRSLNLDAGPVTDPEPSKDWIEATLEMSGEKFAELEHKLNAFVREHDLVCHVKRV